MTDKFTVEKRSDIMSKIRSTDTKEEIRVRHWLYHNGIRYRKNYTELPGKPDIAILKYKIAIFVNGCFWHGHDNCKFFHLPKSRVDYWKDKIENNKIRDLKNINSLISEGWNVFIIWECQLNNDFNATMNTLLKNIVEIKNING